MPSSSRNPYSRFVPSEEVGEVTQWQFGDVDGPNPFHALPTPEEPSNLMDEEQQQALVQKTWDEAFAHGVAQGQQEASMQWQQRMDEYIATQGQQATEQLTQIVQQLHMRLEAMQQHMSEQMLHLACDIARHVVRQELTAQPEKLMPVVQEALGLLVQDGRAATVRLHPDDMAALNLSFVGRGIAVQWLADASVEPGGCLVESAGTVIDATLPKRWERAIASLGLRKSWQQEAGIPLDVTLQTEHETPAEDTLIPPVERPHIAQEPIEQQRAATPELPESESVVEPSPSSQTVDPDVSVEDDALVANKPESAPYEADDLGVASSVENFHVDSELAASKDIEASESAANPTITPHPIPHPIGSLFGEKEEPK